MTAKTGTQQIIDHVTAAAPDAGLTGELFEIAAPVETSVLMKDRRYKTIPFKGREELIFKGMRAGKRSEFIFEFAPVDDQPYTQVEFAEKKVFNAIAGFEKTMIGVLGLGATHTSWPEATKDFCARIVAQEEAAKAAVEAESDSIYENNPNYGIF